MQNITCGKKSFFLLQHRGKTHCGGYDKNQYLQGQRNLLLFSGQLTAEFFPLAQTGDKHISGNHPSSYHLPHKVETFSKEGEVFYFLIWVVMAWN